MCSWVWLNSFHWFVKKKHHSTNFKSYFVFCNLRCSTLGFYSCKIWHTPKLFDGFNYESKGDYNRRSCNVLPGSQHLGVEGRAATLGWGLRRLISNSIIHMDMHKPNNKLVSAWLEHFDAWTSHGQTRTHKIHHSLSLVEATTFPLIVFSMPNHGASTQMSFCPETPKWESQNSQNWDYYHFGAPITLSINL
jgi:hypothetical protein